MSESRAPGDARRAEFAPIRVEPAYRKVAAALLERITDRTINAGERLPPEIELARQFGVHRGTVREALRELETNGVLKRERGSKLMMVTRPARGDVAAGRQPRARAARRELSRRVGSAHGARAADRRRRGARSASPRTWRASMRCVARLGRRSIPQRGGTGGGFLPRRR